MIIYLTTYLLILFSAIFFSKNKFTEKLSIVFITIVLIVIAGFRGEGIDLDYHNYKSAFESVNSISSPEDFARETAIIEFSFYYISKYTSEFIKDTNILITILFLFYAILGVTFNIIAIYRLTPYPLFAILVYFSYFFMLHEMTQIRAGVALGICYNAIPYIRDKKFFPFILFTGIATVFHYSAIVFALSFFFRSDFLNKKMWLTVLVISTSVGYLSQSFDNSLLQNLNFSTVLESKVEGYSSIEKIPYFSAKLYFSIGTALFFLFLSAKIEKKIRYGSLVIRLYTLSMVFYTLFFSLPAVAYRLTDIFSGIFPILCSYFFFAIPSKFLSTLFVIFVSALFLYQILFGIKIIKEYTFPAL